MSKVITATFIFIALTSTMILYSPSSEAAIYKCTDGSGGITYSHTPCPTQDVSSKMMKSGANTSGNVDCSIANSFALRTATNMRRGQTADAAFGQYGGIDATPYTAIGIINYVHTHKNNKTTAPARIAALSAARCKNGSYGPVRCSDFPHAFIQSMGGCEAAAMGMGAAGYASQMNGLGEAERPLSQAQRTTRTSNVSYQSKSTSKGVNQKCINRLNAKLEDVFDQMREGGSASYQTSLQKKRNSLKDKLEDC